MKQQFTGSYTLDVASRTITLFGVEIPQERLAVVINSTVGFVYHNIEHEPTALVRVSGGDTTIVFPRYKDCETHRNSDALSIFYDDGVDLGQLVQSEFDQTQTLITGFREEVELEWKPGPQPELSLVVAVSAFPFYTGNIWAIYPAGYRYKDSTQDLLHTEFDETQAGIADFYTEIENSSALTQALLQSEFDQTQALANSFRAEAKAESDQTQAILQSEFDETQALASSFQAESKAESDQTQAIFQSEFDQTQTLLTAFRAEAKAESDQTQAILGLKLPILAGGLVAGEVLDMFSFANGSDVSFTPGGYGPSQIIFYKAGVPVKTLKLAYGTSGDSLGKLISIST